MIDWTKAVSIAERVRHGKLARANIAIKHERLDVLYEFMEAYLEDDRPRLARIQKYKADVKAWLAKPGGPDLADKPVRTGGT